MERIAIERVSAAKSRPASMRTNNGQDTAMTIAVIGATGNTGRAVVKELRALGQDPICVIRNGEKAAEVLGENAKTAVAELTDRPALEKALTGVQGVFVVTGHNPDMAEQQNNILDAALKVGTEYLVRVSGARAAAKADSESVVGRGHAAINERLKASNPHRGLRQKGPRPHRTLPTRRHRQRQHPQGLRAGARLVLRLSRGRRPGARAGHRSAGC